MVHVPSGFLSDTNATGQLARTDTILRVGNQPDRREPLVQA